MAYEALLELLEIPELIWFCLKHIGTSIRWLFLRSQFSYKEIYKKSFNGLLGLFFLIIIILILVFILNS